MPSASLAKQVFEAGGDLIGPVVGALAQVDPVTAASLGGGVTVAIKQLGAGIAQVLGERQQARVVDAATVAIDAIGARRLAGDEPRRDWFPDDGQPAHHASELLEGTLAVAAKAHEQKKARHLGLLYSGFVFDEAISAGRANFLLKLADDLTYRQLALLALFGRDEFREGVRGLQLARDEGDARIPPDMAIELQSLSQTGALGLTQPDGSVVPLIGTYDGSDASRAQFALIEPTNGGSDLFRLMRLDTVPAEDVEGAFYDLGGLAHQRA